MYRYNKLCHSRGEEQEQEGIWWLSGMYQVGNCGEIMVDNGDELGTTHRTSCEVEWKKMETKNFSIPAFFCKA